MERRLSGENLGGVSEEQRDALLIAILRRDPPDAVLHRSDQGSQYSSEDFQRLLESHGITCSMSRAGNCWDSSRTGKFLLHPKTERLGRRRYRTRKYRNELRGDVFNYIERFYNPKRRHSAIGDRLYQPGTIRKSAMCLDDVSVQLGEGHYRLLLIADL